MRKISLIFGALFILCTTLSFGQATVSGVTATDALGVAVPNATYSTTSATNTIGIQITFSAAVVITGSPRLLLETGNIDRYATYVSGSGTTVLNFLYVIVSGDEAADLDYKSVNALELNGGTLKGLLDGLNANLTLVAPAAAGSISDNQAIVIDASIPTVVSVTGVNGYYNVGEVVAITVTFSEAVTIVGGPTIALETGVIDRNATAVAAGPLVAHTFNYTVQAGDVAADLSYKSVRSLVLAGGTIRDAANNDAKLLLPVLRTANSLVGSSNVKVDTSVPTVTNVTSTSLNGTYDNGDVINIQVVFSEAVYVTVAAPSITLETGGNVSNATYTSGNGTNTLNFRYVVQTGDVSTDLCYDAGLVIDLNGGAINDVSGNVATLTLAAVGAYGSLSYNKNIVLSAVAPTVTNVSSTSVNGNYITGQVIDIQVTFSEVVKVTGTPQLTLETGVADAVVNYYSGNGTNTLVFKYTVAAVTEISTDLDYAAVGSLALNAGTIKDLKGNNATLTLVAPAAAGSLAANNAITVNSAASSPACTLTNVTSSKLDGVYSNGEVILIQVVFSQNVKVIGKPYLTLELGATDRDATYYNGSGTNTLQFKYVVQAGDVSADLDYVDATSLYLNGGTIKDYAGNNADLTTMVAPGNAGSLGANKAIRIASFPLAKSASTNSQLDMNIYPIPNNGTFTVDLSGFDSQVKLSVVNILGKTVYSENLNSNRANLNLNLSKGIYFVNVESNNQSLVKKISIK